MLKNLREGDIIKTKAGDGKIRKIGPASHGDRGGYAWVMITLDINGQPAYCVAREDELANE
jgi:hypothetical protein